MTKHIPEVFLMLSHEGIARVTITMEQVYNIDALLTRFSTEKLLVIPRVAEHAYGIMHQVVWTSEPPRRMSVLELTSGKMVLATKYKQVIVKTDNEHSGDSWVSPCFIHDSNSFDLRCVFQFALWAEAGLQLFLGLNNQAQYLQLWVHYDGQIYRPPFGNIYDNSCQLCLGHNDKGRQQIFGNAKQSDNVSLDKALTLLSDSLWNADTFNAARDIPVLNKLVRFDSSIQELPMLPPLDPAMIKKCLVAANKDLAQITKVILTNQN